MDKISSVLNGYLLPFWIILCGCILARKIKLHSILKPQNFFRYISESSCGNKSSPFKSMCVALAGTLGVGNIAGVGSAIASGGAGAVFWMWIGAVFSMSVKYGEVVLAVKYRSYSKEKRFVGGSMFTMKKALKRYIGSKSASVVGGIFAMLCIVNSFIMGNVIQSNAAGAVFVENKWFIGLFLSFGLLLTAIVGAKKISNITLYLIPPLSLLYLILSLSVIFSNIHLIPNIFIKIVKSAFSTRAILGGVYGYGLKEAIRFGITRGIFSNEAGCGTAPSAHASAEVKSPHHQGCYGILEVITDTLILCSMTAFVVLISDSVYGTNIEANGIELTLIAFEKLIGRGAYYAIGVAIILFAFATIIAQLYYGDVAICYFTDRKLPRYIFIFTSVMICLVGTIIEPNGIWLLSDVIIGIMTVMNTLVLILLRKEIGNISRENR